MEKNRSVLCVGESLGTNGEGIVRVGNCVLFVPGLLPGEKARVKVLKVKGSVAYGKIEELLVPAEERVRPVCPVFSRCGGCQLQHMNYRLQMRFKSMLVREALKKIGGIEYEVPSCVRSEKQYAYRNKLQIPVGKNGEKNTVGFFAERSHRIVDTEECPIHPDWAKEVIAALRKFMETCGLDGYDEETGSGEIRHLVVRELRQKFLVTLVVTERDIRGIDYFLFLLDGIFKEYSFCLNFNSEKTNVVFGSDFHLLKGPGFYECSENGIFFEAGVNTFLQVNEGVRSSLYERACSFVSAEDTVIDCYAGGGLLTAMFAKRCVRAYGIEVVPEASACADKVKERNGLSEKMENLCAKVEDALSAVLKQEKDAVVVLDPPRAGVDRGVLKEIMTHGVKKVILISCNPATLARDLGILTGSLCETEDGLKKTGVAEGQYRVEFLQPYDMFPQTKHVETLVCLSKGRN